MDPVLVLVLILHPVLWVCRPPELLALERRVSVLSLAVLVKALGQCWD